MTDPTPLSRRTFVARAAALGAGVMIVPRHVLGGRGFVAPSDQLAVAMIGGGGMGAANAYALVKGGQRIVAIADVDQAHVDRSARGRANPDQRTGKVDPDGVKLVEQYGRAARHADFRRMLEREKGFDAVVVATPDHVHAVAAKMAMEAGKHVYVQKPLTYSVHEARVLRETARRTGVVTQMGNQGHSSRDAQLINQWVRAGALGPVREVHVWTNRPIWPQGVPRPAAAAPVAAGAEAPRPPFGNPYYGRTVNEQLAAALMASGTATPPAGLDWDLYLGPAKAVPYHPIYHPFNWRGFVDFGVGALGDMGAHLIDHPYWALGLTYPTSVEATSTPWGGDPQSPASYPQAMTVHYEFPARGEQPPVRMLWYDGGLMPPRHPALPDAVKLDRGGGVMIVGDKGVLMHETYGAKPRIYPEALFQQVAPDYVRELQEQEQREQAQRNNAQTPGGAGQPRQLPTTPVVAHEINWANAIKNKTQAICPFDYAGPLTETMLLGIVALRAGQGRKITYDGQRMALPNAPDAEQYLRREYRDGWTL
jgi:predicted dehydrogenase